MQRIVTQLVSGYCLKIKSGGFPLDFICFKIDFQSYFSRPVQADFSHFAKLLNKIAPNY